jgi:transglutaminase-like putative cysteine protease
MNCRTAVSIVLIFFFFAGCAQKKEQDTSVYVPNIVTADIQAGIEKYIEDQSRSNDGYFKLAFEKKDLLLKLVRVHVEYLANLGPRKHFACVDLADTDGEVYDVDFFMKGDPGAMTVTETTVHKINGQPLYAWEPRMWLPLAVTDPFQTIDIKSIKAPGKQKFLDEAEHGNKILYLELGSKDSKKEVEIIYQVKRLEKSAYAEDLNDPSKYLAAENLVPINDDFRSIAEKVIKGKKGKLVQARALYDHVIDRMSYKRYGEGWGKGDAVYACDIRSGNCTDFHSYFIALARSVNMPARFSIGAAIPSARDEGEISGYHCWAEFFAEGKWWPVDISEADKYSNLATYYFGHHPANRIEFSRGRDIVVQPGPTSGPINFFAYPVFEIASKPVKVKVRFSFKRTKSSKG